MKRTISALFVAALGIFSVGDAFAYLTYFGSDPNGDPTAILPTLSTSEAAKAQARFFGLGTAPQVETFQSQNVGTPAGGTLTLSFGTGAAAVSATLTGTGGAVEEVSTNPTDGRYSVPGGTKFWAATAKAPTATNPAETFTILFNERVEAFGFFGIDVGDFGGELSVELLDVSGNQIGPARQVNTLTSGQDGSVLYFGIRAQVETEWFRSVRFRLNNATRLEDAFAFDSFSVVRGISTAPPPPGGSVPEPGSLALAGLALLGLGLARRRA